MGASQVSGCCLAAGRAGKGLSLIQYDGERDPGSMTYNGMGGCDGNLGVIFGGYDFNSTVRQWIVGAVAPDTVEWSIELISKCVCPLQGKNILVIILILVVIDGYQVI